ncbi:MAG TPA: type II secretion system F family protein [Mycobacteriales bacterium]|nr:type II secretion system F family protein [Mycobacteriales bacterium]
MGAFVGLLFGVGLFLVWRACTAPAVPAPDRLGWRDRVEEQLAQAGIEGVAPGRLVGASAALGVVAFVLVAGLSRVAVIGLVFGGVAAAAPFTVVRARRRKRAVELREVWPEVVDNLASAVRAGLSLPEAVSQVATRGPEVLRPAFTRFAADYRATGRFGECLDRLKASLADPVGDRVVESLRMAREVGGTDLGRLLRTLSAFLREDARTRAELKTRQGWTVGAARLALSAPWLLLLLLSTRPAAVAAYGSATGAAVLLGGGAVSLVAYRVMLRIARLPTERRVLR